MKLIAWENDFSRETSKSTGCSSSTTVKLADALLIVAQFCARALHGATISASTSMPRVKLALNVQSTQVSEKPESPSVLRYVSLTVAATVNRDSLSGVLWDHGRVASTKREQLGLLWERLVERRRLLL